jgi:hypothetical protein
LCILDYTCSGPITRDPGARRWLPPNPGENYCANPLPRTPLLSLLLAPEYAHKWKFFRKILRRWLRLGCRALNHLLADGLRLVFEVNWSFFSVALCGRSIALFQRGSQGTADEKFAICSPIDILLDSGRKMQIKVFETGLPP